MHPIPCYNNKGEKDRILVQNFYRDTREEVDALFRDLDEDTDRFYYRGLGSARYKLYTSGQRFIIENGIPWTEGDPFHFYSAIVAKTRASHGAAIEQLMKLGGVHYNNHVALFSYIQHYGGPTPFLDFSRDPYVALYFATEKGRAKATGNELDDYFSLYRVPRKLSEKFNLAWFEAQRRTGFEAEGMLDVAWWWQSLILAIDDQTIMDGLKVEGRVANNLNVINQKGLFLTNVRPDTPLLELILEHEREYMRASAFDMRVPSKRFKCDNIHVDHLDYVRDKLKARTPAITEDFIYPDHKKIFESVKAEILAERLARV